MKASQNNLVKDGNAHEQVTKKLITNGYFRIRSVNGTCTLKLKGDFTSKNIKVINKAMIMSGSSRRKCIELDMSAVDTIDMRAMALLTISLKTLKENGINARITGIDEETHKLANALGLHCVAQVN
jgi:anti-anti-sigma factor